MTDPRATYVDHSQWSNPGSHATWLAAIPPDPDAIVRHVSGLATHCVVPRMRGMAPPQAALRDVEARRVDDIVARLQGRSANTATAARAEPHRLFGVCAHFALLATSVLRCHGIPARSRVGFARYFIPDRYEDHWITEFWDGRRWRRLDAQLSAESVGVLGIAFAPSDLPPDQFIDAATVWQQLRSGALDPERVGISVVGLTGAWFCAQSVLRDAAALASMEMLPWDTWGPGRAVSPFARTVPAAFAESLDAVAPALAGSPEPSQISETQTAHPWLRPTTSIFSLAFPNGWPDGIPDEVTP